MQADDERFARRAIRRKRLFLALSLSGVAIAAALVFLYGVLWWRDPGFPLASRAVIVVLILLNARQNLRQYKYARLLEGLMAPDAR